MENILTAAQARDKFAEVVGQASFGNQRTVITRHGKSVAVVVPMVDLELLHELERHIDFVEASKALEEAKGDATTTLDALKEELGLE